MRIREARKLSLEMKSYIALAIIFLALAIVGVTSRTIYFIKIIGVALILIFMVLEVLFRLLTGEGLISMIVFHMRRDLNRV